METAVRIVAFLVISLPGIVVVAFLSTRMLGVRRSWIDIAVSAVIGWLVGLGVAIGAAQGDLSDAELFRNTAIVGLIATMGVAVGFELLAKPGSSHRGLLVIPRPVRYVRERVDVIRRTREIVGIAYDNGFGPVIGSRRRAARRAEVERVPAEVRARQALEQCGGMFVKLGQIASTRSDLFSGEVIAQLQLLQSDVAPEDPENMRVLIEAELGDAVEAVFAEFDWEPLGCASIAQVYRATLPTGEPVVVKAQRPGVADVVERDSRVLLQLTRTIQDDTAVGQQYQVNDLANEFVANVAGELDFGREADNARAIRTNMADEVGVRVPVVYGDLSTPRLLVMERFDGPTSSDSARVDALGVDRNAMADAFLRAMLKQMMLDGYFHADPHPGNVIVLSDGDVGMIDFGACGRLDPLEEASLREMLVATSLRDASMLRQSVSELMDLGTEVDDDALERSLARFLMDHVAPGQGISGTAINELLEMLQAFGIAIPANLTMFARSIVTLEGTLQVIAPGYRMSDAAQQVATEWVEAKKTEVADSVDDLLQQELLAQLPVLRQLPRHADRLSRLATRGELTVRSSRFSTEADTRFVSKMVNRVVLGFLGASLGLLSAIMIVSGGGPEFAGDVSIANFLGYVGLFGSAVLTLRVIAAVLREGLN